MNFSCRPRLSPALIVVVSHLSLYLRYPRDEEKWQGEGLERRKRQKWKWGKTREEILSLRVVKVEMRISSDFLSLFFFIHIFLHHCVLSNNKNGNEVSHCDPFSCALISASISRAIMKMRNWLWYEIQFLISSRRLILMYNLDNLSVPKHTHKSSYDRIKLLPCGMEFNSISKLSHLATVDLFSTICMASVKTFRKIDSIIVNELPLKMSIKKLSTAAARAISSSETSNKLS